MAIATFDTQFLTRKDLPTLLVSISKRYTSDLLGKQKQCFEGFVPSRNSLIINFDRCQDLGGVLATVRLENSG